ncbi:tyrosine-type recombinase/integrase [Polaribacter cellanae]|uniref:Tyrosine-type recombinase/integrase n=1 Tax=Polaribacter cellanae TaxID=2818493 RepID=A0A975H5T0_9FLAO|nr:tyrosine-type recombinase/integrase [Polaribacter cellanae]QTE21184.1 tyrosine-type recombinase/integrase [Polaribacter cellanae]QTE21194.1 tyrosine-type recombinase/integrase [Polaribacter cellanae]
MKQLKLQNTSYKVLLQSFTEWLDILGYAESTLYNLPNHIKEFFYWLEKKNINTLENIHTETIKDYYQHLQLRPNETRGGSLSKAYLNKHQQALKKFREYLQKHNYKGFRIHLKTEKDSNQKQVDILTQEEIKELFTTTNYSHQRDSFKLRDKALLVVFYSCGLRRNEVVHLDVSDVFFDKERIYVRKGKNYKERFIPINSYNIRILEDYIFEARPALNIYNSTEALFISQQGKRMQGQSMLNRLKEVIRKTENKELQEKQITLHTLRHSIATHLLQKEVHIEIISKFLGHSSLESTQIYTHLVKQL